MNYKNQWIWGTGATQIPGKGYLSFNFAQGLELNDSDNLGDYFKIGNKLVKLEALKLTYNPENLMEEMTIQTHENHDNKKARQASIQFSPTYKGNVNTEYIILSGKLDYVYGYYSGWVSDEDGQKIQFKKMKGILEISKLKW